MIFGKTKTKTKQNKKLELGLEMEDKLFLLGTRNKEGVLTM